MTIPGNEKQVNALVAAFRARGITVTLADESDIPLHASGTPVRQELAQMYQWTRPHLAIPVHGRTYTCGRMPDWRQSRECRISW